MPKDSRKTAHLVDIYGIMSTMQSKPIYVVYVRSAIYGYIVKYRPFLDLDEAQEWLSIQSMHYSVPKGEGNVWQGDTYTAGIETWSVAV